MSANPRLGLAVLLAACSIPDVTYTPPGDAGGDGGGVPVKLAFAAQPASGVTQQPLEAIEVAIVDAQNATVTSATGTINLALGSNPGGANLLGALIVTATAGVARFTLVGIDRPGTGYTLVASAADLAPATSAPFDTGEPPFALLSTGIYGGRISSVAVSPAGPGGSPTIFAGLATGVYKSVNQGATWTPASFGFDAAAGTLATDPKNPGVAYAVAAGPGGGFAGGASYFLRKTASGGATWLDTADDVARGVGTSVAIDPMNPSILYVGGSKLYRSTTAGASWTELAALAVECPVVAVDPVTPTSVYCTAFDRETLTRKGVYKSIDSGATWAAINAGLDSLDTRDPLVASPLAVFVSAGNALYRSTNGGGTWTDLSIANAFALAYAPSMPSRMYLSRGASGVAVSTDGGATFGTPVNVGDVVQGLAVDPTNPDLVYAAGRDNGVYLSTNGGTSWTFSSVGIATHTIDAIAIAPGAAETVVVSTDIGIFQTTNGGTTWVQASPSTGVVRFDPVTTTRAYLCGGTFATSSNSGASFGGGTATGTGCQQLAVSGTSFYAAGFPGGLRKSTNSGATWGATGLSANFTYAVALGDETGNVVIAASNEGLHRSTNGGSSFTQISLDLADALLADPAMPTRVIAGLSCGTGAGGAQSSGGFRVSTDSGTTFGPVIDGPCVTQLSSNGTSIYAAANPQSMISSDHGATWTQLPTGTPSGLEATALAATPDGQTIYLGTTGGLYRSTTGGR